MSIKSEIKRETDVVRRNHLQRQLDGAKAISHLTNKVDEKKKARMRLVEAVAKIGSKNRIKAEKASRKNRLKTNAKVKSDQGSFR